MFLHFMTLGNIGSAAVAVSLAQAVEAGKVKSGDHVGLIGVGSGLNCSLMSIDW
jgi:3-oxoacyl-[acyl-carrier-protein] synthase-3